ncbi:MAG: restriction endonuclease subunit S [Azoarcus sp.]|nr:restriction endonuclease subunit S [Azoarcus sp.]
MTQWRTARLEDVAQILGGGTPSRTEQRYFGGGIAWATPTDITKLDGLYISKTKETVSDEGLRNSSTKLMPPNAVLLTSRATIGFTAVSTVPICTNQGFINFICGPDLVPEYLAFWLRTQRDKMIQHAGGTTFKEIARGTLRKFEIPVPPVSEQRRIVDLLSRAEGIVRLRREAEKKAAELIPALFLDMFGDPATNPKGWPLVRLGDLAEKMSDGPFGSNLKTSHYVETGVRVIRLQNIGIGELIDDAKAYVSQEHFASLPRHRCLPGDVIIGTLGDPNLRAIVLPPSIPEALNKADCVQFRCRQDTVTAAYICWLMNMPSTLAMAASLVQGITLTRISMGRLREMIVPVPPFGLQNDFADRVETLNGIKSQQYTATAKAQATFHALLASAFA